MAHGSEKLVFLNEVVGDSFFIGVGRRRVVAFSTSFVAEAVSASTSSESLFWATDPLSLVCI